MDHNLIRVLETVGKPTQLFRSPDGSEVLVLPYGGRVLGLFSPQGGENFFWTNPSLRSPTYARELYAGAGWHNSGGDRTFVSPEVDLFYPDFPDLSIYRWPTAVDPGNYRLESDDTALRLVNCFSLTLARSKESVDLRLTKTIEPAPNPLRYERGLVLEDVEYAGYALTTTLTILGETKARVGLWNLLQLPHGGELLAPTYFGTRPKCYFGTIAPEDLIVTDHMVRYKMRASGIQKIGIRAVALAGRVGFVSSVGDRWSMVIRNFNVNPSGEYVDVPNNDITDFGYAVQACNVDCELGRFAELEYHVPAIGRDTGRVESADLSQVWAFHGSVMAIETVMAHLLSSTAYR